MKLTVRSVKYHYQKIPEDYIESLKKLGELTMTLYRYRIDVKDKTIGDLIKLSDDLGQNLIIEKDSYDKPCITIYDDCY